MLEKHSRSTRSKMKRLPSLDPVVQKRVRVALSSGDSARARKELRAVVEDEVDVEAWFKHLEEEKARMNQEEYEQLFAEKEEEEEEDILALAMDALSLDKATVVCPCCFQGELSFVGEQVKCSRCTLSFAFKGTMKGLCDSLDGVFSKHQAESKACGHRPLFSSVENALIARCDTCGLKQQIA